jgi:hypothetical protein
MSSSDNPATAQLVTKIQALTAENARNDLRHIQRLYDDEYFTRLDFRYPDPYYSCDICGDYLLDNRKAFMERLDYDTYDICLDCMIKLMPALHDIICSEETKKLVNRTTTRHRNPDYVLLYPNFTESNWSSSIPYNTIITSFLQQDNHEIISRQDEYCSICIHTSPVLVIAGSYDICPLCIKRLQLSTEESRAESEEDEDD